MSEIDLKDLILVPDTDPILAERMPLYEDFGDKSDEITRVLIDAMFHFDGVGLAANQVGLRIRAFAAVIGGEPMVLFNPTISEVSQNMSKSNEGCLSFPNLALQIMRPEECNIDFQNPQGEGQSLKLKGLDARIVLHELDHLNGIVFTSKVSKMRLDMQKKKLRKKR